LGPNAFCDGSFIAPLGTQQFVPTCNNGFSGTPPDCVPNTCTRDHDCSIHGPNHGISPYYSISCVSGICVCNPTFKWDPSSAALTNQSVCSCDSNAKLALIWNNTNHQSVATCERIGRCYQTSDCLNVVSNINTVSCEPYGTNIFLPPGLNSCVCINGYFGNPGENCVCPNDGVHFESSFHHGHTRIQWCLVNGQCLTDDDCDAGYCSENNGTVGVCQV